MKMPVNWIGTCDKDPSSGENFDQRFKLVSKHGPHFSHEQLMTDNKLN